MKKITALIAFIVCILVLLLCFTLQPETETTDTAESITQEQPQTDINSPIEEYACILTPNTYIYEEETQTTGIFILPCTYYVKILNKGIDHCYVQYLDELNGYIPIYGYCKTAELTFVDYIPSTPYLYYTFTINYYFDGLNQTPTFADESFLYKISVPAQYYGDYTIGSSTYCYILREGKFGYVPKEENISYIENTEYAEKQKALEQTIKLDNYTSGLFTDGNFLKIIAVCSLTLFVLVVLFLVFKREDIRPKKSNTVDYYTFEENDRY